MKYEIKNRFFSVILAFCLLFSMTTFASASNFSKKELMLGSDQSRSIDKSATLDFSQGSVWKWDFDNNAFMIWNHQNVAVKYLSNSPETSYAFMSVVLYCDYDGDGIYEIYDSSGGYSYVLGIGGTVTISLPYKNEVVKYRIVFENRTPSVTQAVVQITTS